MSVVLLTNPKETALRPDVRWVSIVTTAPMLGILSRPLVLWSGFAPLNLEVPENMVRAGVIVNCDQLLTAEPAGLIPIEPRSPPRAVTALPRPAERAVP